MTDYAIARRIVDLHSRNEESVDRVYSVEDVTRYLMFARQFKPKVFLRWYTLTTWNANRTFCGNFHAQIDYLTNYIFRNALFLLQISIINYMKKYQCAQYFEK